ncbi:DUF1837 domain-containing protein [Paraflavitalea pollutisoli]|uniref:HamA C-terminal domain-containing protein n=1 Tax=Paraflavitalea pollutisoli TaxID=3034143 RepID=UPI0023EAFADD|nr:DUF1837 domain-containing protein [Paraflavitalea sp. H1-2-19X]
MSTIITPEQVEALLTTTRMLMNHVYYVQQPFNLIPAKDHYGACINYSDLMESRMEFCEELLNTINEWVYSEQRAQEIINSFLSEDRSQRNAWNKFTQYAMKKFRPRDGRDITLQGQFGELLLFNFIQHFFRAVPLLRKMPIALTPAMERLGADAIHYKQQAEKHLFFLGEAKTYTAEYRFAAAFEDALQSILKTYYKHRTELGSYLYDDFIDPALQEVARGYINNTIAEKEVHLVSIIVYHETKQITKNSEAEIKQQIMQVIEERGQRLERELFNKIPEGMHPRFHYIILPVWDLDDLLKTHFEPKIGRQ